MYCLVMQGCANKKIKGRHGGCKTDQIVILGENYMWADFDASKACFPLCPNMNRYVWSCDLSSITPPGGTKFKINVFCTIWKTTKQEYNLF